MMSYTSELQSIISQDGFYGLTRGLSAQLLRDAPGLGVYFCLYHYLKKFFYQENLDQRTKMESYLRLFGCGALSGMITYTFAFPADQIKSRMMAYKGHCRPSILQFARMIYAQNGLRSFYRGIHV